MSEKIIFCLYNAQSSMKRTPFVTPTAIHKVNTISILLDQSEDLKIISNMLEI